MDYRTALCVAQGQSKKEQCVQHVNKLSDDRFEVSDWFHSLVTVASYENGKLKS